MWSRNINVPSLKQPVKSPTHISSCRHCATTKLLQHNTHCHSHLCSCEEFFHENNSSHRLQIACLKKWVEVTNPAASLAEKGTRLLRLIHIGGRYVMEFNHKEKILHLKLKNGLIFWPTWKIHHLWKIWIEIDSKSCMLSNWQLQFVSSYSSSSWSATDFKWRKVLDSETFFPDEKKRWLLAHTDAEPDQQPSWFSCTWHLNSLITFWLLHVFCLM